MAGDCIHEISRDTDSPSYGETHTPIPCSSRHLLYIKLREQVMTKVNCKVVGSKAVNFKLRGMMKAKQLRINSRRKESV